MNQGLQDGSRIREFREHRGLSIGELAARLGIKPQSLSNIEWNNKPVSAAIATRIARELGVTLDDIAPRLVRKVADDLGIDASLLALTPRREPQANGGAAA